MVEREVLINVRVSVEERDKLRALAESNDETMAQVVRRWVRSFYRERFGEEPPKAATKPRARR